MYLLKLVPRSGLEPVSWDSKSQILTKLNYRGMERNAGLEPASLAWKAKAQPIYQIRNDGA